MADWRPMGQSDDVAGELHEGIPPWMERSLFGWIQKRTVCPGVSAYARDVALVEAYDRITRSTRPVAEDFAASGIQALKFYWSFSDHLGRDRWMADWVTFLDYLVAAPNRSNTDSDALEEILLDSGSAWKVGTREGHPGLERRVPLGVQQAAEETMRTAGRAGERLSEAWHSAFGVTPNPVHAYAMAVKAVEDATIPVVVPKQSGATLSHVIGQLRNDGDWSLPLTREHHDAPTSQTVLRMVQGLWKGHHDRHGGDPSAPMEASQTEAEAAVTFAVPLVQWFTSGAVARR